MKNAGMILASIGFIDFMVGASLMDSTGKAFLLAVGMVISGLAIIVIGGILYDTKR